MGNIQTVKKISKEKGISLAFVCRQIGRSHGYLAEIANRDGDVPEKMLGPIANALGVTVAELTGESEQKEKPTPGEGSRLDVEAKAFAEKFMQLDESTRALFNKMLDAAIAEKLEKNG